MNLNLEYTEFDAPIALTARSALGKRGFKGGLRIDMAKIPPKVLQELLVSALTDHVRKSLPKGEAIETATREDCIAEMQKQYNLLTSGALSAKTARKAPARNPVTDLAKALVKKTIQARSAVEINKKDLNTSVNADFKRYTAWKKPSCPPEEKEAFARTAKFIEAHIRAAEAQIAAQKAMQESLAAEVMGQMDEPVATAQPTPTQKVVEAKAKAKAKPAAR